MSEREIPEPTVARIAQVELICACYARLLGDHLLPPHLQGAELFRAAWEAPFVIVSHDIQADPRFNFGNRPALNLWEMEIDDFVGLPSRYSAEAEHRGERARLLREVAEKGFFANYQGVRTSNTGRRFRIERALVFNLNDASGALRGQAATFRDWTYL